MSLTASSSPLSGQPVGGKSDVAQRRRGPAATGRRLRGVRKGGVPLTALNRDAGYLFQADALFPWKIALDTAAIGLETAGIPRRQARERAQAWLARVGLGAFGNPYRHMLSGGQRKRVGLAQVLIRDPKILLMDEPFGPLDAQTRQIMANPSRSALEYRSQGGAVRDARPSMRQSRSRIGS